MGQKKKMGASEKQTEGKVWEIQKGVKRGEAGTRNWKEMTWRGKKEEVKDGK